MLRSPAILLCTLFFAAPAGAATCGGDFNAFLLIVDKITTANRVHP
jgi:hypothetical protein